jgi:hypothetical protein
MNFQMVHAGAAFLYQTAALLSRHRNLYATLETVFAYVVVKPRVFARVLGTLLQACGSGQLIYASGSNLSHPAPQLAAFDEYEFPADVLAEFGFPQISAADRRKILGENALRLHGLDAGTVRQRTEADEFSRARARGHARPWQQIRAQSVPAGGLS